jgi:Tfp pilus assembly protein PilZ
MPERSVVRIMPRRPVRVELVSADSSAYGTLANISELGVCVWTDRVLRAGDIVVLGLRFTGEGEPFQAAGCVVWSDRPEISGRPFRCGLRWPDTTSPHHEMLKTLIASC